MISCFKRQDARIRIAGYLWAFSVVILICKLYLRFLQIEQRNKSKKRTSLTRDLPLHPLQPSYSLNPYYHSHVHDLSKPLSPADDVKHWSQGLRRVLQQ